MKFGANLRKTQLPQWAHAYIDYTGLKYLIKATAASENADLTEFFASVESNIEKVEDFYNAKLQSSLGSLRNLRTDFWDAELSNDPLDQDEFNLLTGCLLELREKLLKLLLFANVNFRGFERISRKLDAAFPATNAAEPFLSSKVFPTAFAGNGSLGEALDFTEKWLSSLGYPNGRPSSVLARPRRVVSSRVMNTVDPDKLEAMETAIKNDIPVVLRNCQRGLQGNPGLAQALLQRCITHQARNSCSRMVQLVASAWSANVFKRNCLHQLVIFIARSEFEQLEAAGPPWAVPGQFPLHGKRYLPQDYQPRNNESICFLEYLLELRSAEWNWDPDAVDSEGRRHIHYAAEFGLVTVCDALLNHAQDFPGPHAQHEIDGAMWCDWEHMSPLHYSVANGNIRTAARLLQHRPEPGREPLSTGEKAIGDRLPSRIPVVALATRNDDIHMIILLLSAGRDANVQDVNGETPLHIAARLGFAACVKVLLNNGGAERTVDIADMSTWTPLFTAAANGNIGAVRPLLDAGADPNRLDATGWSAKEHAAYRGHLSISKLLPSPTSLEVPTRGSHRIGTAAVPPPDGIPSGIPSRETLQDPPIKEAMIVVCLGSMDTRKDAQPVELDPISADTKLYTQLNRPMALVVRATGAASNSTKFNLPLLEDISTEPVIFMTKDASQVKILFDIEARSGATSSGPLIGRGVALVSSLNGSILENRINLSGDFAVPITAADSLAVIGRANFNFIIVTPFSHPKADDVSDHSWRIKPRTVIGHRGLGKNDLDWKKFVQMGENTIESFEVAKEAGASYVEFDVQLTKGLTPVIYHDFLMSETGIDAPVHTVTEAQFLHIGRGETSHASEPRSRSAGDPYIDAERRAGDARMAHTRGFSKKSWKGNGFGHFVKSPFITLNDAFEKLPDDLGFNVEVKYPMLSEAQDEEMLASAVEPNVFVDKILKAVFDLAGDRKVVFSSFHPDLCIALVKKQRRYPVLFLSDAGAWPMADRRAQSLQEAVRHVKRWGLAGIVAAAEVFVLCPSLIRKVKREGLLCLSYGTENNDTELVKRQFEEGVDAVIVDRVEKICEQVLGKPTRRRPKEPKKN